jgi:hypothetical protein
LATNYSNEDLNRSYPTSPTASSSPAPSINSSRSTSIVSTNSTQQTNCTTTGGPAGDITQSSSSNQSSRPRSAYHRHSQHLNRNEIKNEDFEIVVILEGNIETTGASCHIRTSYLPQEILFGYRFVPIYPKFTDFEYLFDYAKFDQVEPFQSRLFHLNVAHLNRHLNYVCDTKKEDKNYQMTCQNTLQNQDELIAKKSLKSYYRSVKSLRTGAGVAETDVEARTTCNKSFVPIQTILSAFLANGSVNNNSLNVADAIILNQPELNKSVEINVDCADGPPQANSSINVEPPGGRNGRFTVVPVVASNNANLLITTLAAEEKKDLSNRRKFFQKKNSANNQSLNHKHQAVKSVKEGVFSPKSHQSSAAGEVFHHHRANSLPPIYSASNLEYEENEKYQNHCHLNGVFSETNLVEEGADVVVGKLDEPSDAASNNRTNKTTALFFIDDDEEKNEC